MSRPTEPGHAGPSGGGPSRAGSGEVPSREALLADAMVQMADTLVADFDLVELLTALTDRCVDVLGVSAAGVMLAGPSGELRVMASSSEAMRVLELFELQAHEGPCLDAFTSGAPTEQCVLSLSGDRWPRFAPEAIDAGFSVVMALPMRLRGSVIGALNLFHVDSAPVTEPDIAAAKAFADIATIAILQHRAAIEARTLNDQLNYALNSRIVIEQAKGTVAERRGFDMEQAFNALRHYARNQNLRLATVAGAVIDGTLSASELELAGPRIRR